MERTFLVTGGFGHLGSTIASRLLEGGEKVIAFDIRKQDLPKGSGDCGHENLEVVIGDIARKKDLEKAFEKAKGTQVFVVHCAGIVSITAKNDRKVYDVNVRGTRNVVELCSKYKTKRLVYVSSVHAIKEKSDGTAITETTTFNPSQVVGQYARTKAIATKMVLDETKKGLDAVVVHPSGIIGPGDIAIGHTTRMFVDFLNGRLSAAISGGYDFVDVRDVANGILAALEKGSSGECYILSNRFVAVKELLNLTAAASGKKPIRTFLPLWFIKPLIPLAELYYRIRKAKPLFTSYSLSTLKSNTLFSHEKASKDLGYSPRPLETTVYETVEWIRKSLQSPKGKAKGSPKEKQEPLEG